MISTQVEAARAATVDDARREARAMASQAAEKLFTEQRAIFLDAAARAAEQLAKGLSIDAQRQCTIEARAISDRATSALASKTATELEALSATCAAKRETLEARVIAMTVEAAQRAEKKAAALQSDVDSVRTEASKHQDEVKRSVAAELVEVRQDVAKKLSIVDLARQEYGKHQDEVKRSVEEGIDSVRKDMVATVEQLNGQHKGTIANINNALEARDQAIAGVSDQVQKVQAETHRAIAANSKVVEANNGTIARSLSGIVADVEKQVQESVSGLRDEVAIVVDERRKADAALRDEVGAAAASDAARSKDAETLAQLAEAVRAVAGRSRAAKDGAKRALAQATAAHDAAARFTDAQAALSKLGDRADAADRERTQTHALALFAVGEARAAAGDARAAVGEAKAAAGDARAAGGDARAAAAEAVDSFVKASAADVSSHQKPDEEWFEKLGKAVTGLARQARRLAEDAKSVDKLGERADAADKERAATHALAVAAHGDARAAASDARAAAAESRAAAGNAVDAFSSAAVADAMRPSAAALERVEALQRAVNALSDDVAALQRLDGGAACAALSGALAAARAEDAALKRWTEGRLAQIEESARSDGGPLSPRTRHDVESLKSDVAAASSMTQQAMALLESTADDLRDRVAKVVSGTAVTDTRLTRCETTVSSVSRSYARLHAVIERLRRETPDARHAAARRLASPSRSSDVRVSELLEERALTIGAIEELARALDRPAVEAAAAAPFIEALSSPPRAIS